MSVNPIVWNNPALLESLQSLNALRGETLNVAREKPVIGQGEVIGHILQRWEAKGNSRIVAGICGFPASGKTTFAKSLSQSINHRLHTNVSIHLPMDGFHFHHERLLAEGLEAIKGDLTTFDVTSFVRIILDFIQKPNSAFSAPDYAREKHDVVENAIQVKPEVRILITEGIYVGYPGPVWESLRPLLDILFYLDVSPERCADRILDRSLAAARNSERITKQLEKDFRFMKTCVLILPHADYIVDGEAGSPNLC